MATAKVKLLLLFSEVKDVKRSPTFIQSCSWLCCLKHVFLKILFVYVCVFRRCSAAAVSDKFVSSGSLL